MCFRALLMKQQSTLNLEPQGKGAFVSGGENARLKVGMRSDPELRGIRNSEELAYFSRNTVQISEETYPDEHESYFKFLQLLLYKNLTMC